MLTFTNIFLLLLIVSSLIFSSIHARNLVSFNGVFKLNLIHRNSPLSPHYNSSLTLRERLESAPLGSISRGHNIHLSTSYYKTPNDAKFSALSPSTGDYLIKISIGTPQVEFMAAADTGSDLIWIQCSPCESCLSTKSQPFNTKKSSTYNVIPCTSPTCKYIDLTGGCTTNKSSSSCVYYASYGDGTQSVGFLATETISLPTSDATSKSLPSSIFGCGFVNQDQSFNQMGGIVGLGQGPASLISQLGPSINYKFSYCLAPLSLNVTSKLTFGADVTGLGVVSTPFRSAKTPTFYILSLNAITIGDKDKDTQCNLVPLILIYKSSLEHCYDTTQLSGSGAQFKPPDVVFHFQGGNVVLKALNTFRDMGHGVSCLAMVATNDTNIFGNIAQVNFEVGYDLQAKQVSFAPADCTNH
ncbi:aspartic proteinase CDR1 [Beta vulgaris subsp. vulgaris]|uniref:aspartic proteinase CDR1 n=1 Tax=Beta vulgaris subsp. vulgaris TaxID=3555 RepID=UPI0025470FA7|nr:aspartic proteinase CDR1 [Beta vulgaris subsp. vulgaris]